MNEKKNGNETREGVKKSGIPTGVIVTVFFLVTVTAMVIIFFNFLTSVEDPEQEKLYEKYYVMIAPEQESSFWNEVYESARKAGEEKNIYVEWLGKSMLRRYSREDQLRIAIAESVDGIIVSADESEEMKELISLATDKKIPVVTLVSDCPSSDRCSFVGINNYNIGREYGERIVKLAKTKKGAGETVKVAVLVDSYSEEAGQNILCIGIQETVENGVRLNDTDLRKVEVTLVPIDESNSFSTQEGVRELVFGDESLVPDIIVCLSETETTSAYQAVVDYNRVGVITVLGYHDSEAILNAIDRNVIEATISVDTDQLGSSCVGALAEFSELGHTSQYFTAESLMIDASNVSEYLKEAPNEG
ncbi:MAG: substrate-binding domain-containing protein [Lachnospiraceae bacterium]|nr:substrate-binding domain-containing protein [Lachnospiraceae bacterium]